MDRSIVHAGTDFPFRHALQHLIAIYASLVFYQYRIEVAAMDDAIRHGGGKLDGQPREFGIVVPPDFVAPAQTGLHCPELMKAQRRLDVGHVADTRTN
jgi:hypothetical protein